MSFISFLKSKAFFTQLAIAIVALFVLGFIILKWLDITTNNGEFETVPDLKGKSIKVAQIELENNNLVMQIQDSANFNPNYPKFSVIDQDPKANEQVKENRKIYITLNPSGYRKIAVPDLYQKSYRQAKPMIEALGFKVGKKTYIDNIGKDMVLGLRYQGKVLKPGTKLPKTTAIDVVLGNGNRP
ncbi:PASTA domain-containing protein [Olleya aquimaris]|uniref:PASTA domain-containing protein n=1 Tax=Olleya sediminilitoris TaxID=2795739 RepID=A0ABS1WLS2_9FLAO|nr:PASTA domain-containing protein [Olleya sediminilitoris]AXO80163.1 PASTA domain-containing protein [Olleya aquimaris]MBL7560059.1 PASTA domain-containing protein [Olleya sediminilitoris]